MFSIWEGGEAFVFFVSVFLFRFVCDFSLFFSDFPFRFLGYIFSDLLLAGVFDTLALNRFRKIWIHTASIVDIYIYRYMLLVYYCKLIDACI